MLCSTSLTGQLLARGDRLYIESGRLKLEASSGLAVPDDWLEFHHDQLVAEILTCAGIDALIYQSYSTGNYGRKRMSGVTLQFASVLTTVSPYAVFNAELTRLKATALGGVGSPLPAGRFRVGKRSGFYKFWQASGLDLPPRRSSFYDYMGNLKGILFVGDFKHAERLISDSIRPLTITFQQLFEAYCRVDLPDSAHTVSVQQPDNSHTEPPYNVIPQQQISHEPQSDSATGIDSYGKRYQGSAGLRSNVTPPKRPIEQTVDEWLADYS